MLRPYVGELLYSWLGRIAAIYRVPLGELLEPLDLALGLLGAVKDWAILADQKGPNRYNAMATRMSPAPTEF